MQQTRKSILINLRMPGYIQITEDTTEPDKQVIFSFRDRKNSLPEGDKQIVGDWMWEDDQFLITFDKPDVKDDSEYGPAP
jgi:hypothetical protein